MKQRVLICSVVACLGLAWGSSAAFADPAKGQKIFLKQMKEPCAMNGGQMAVKHTQQEWKAIQDAGKLNEALLKICPTAQPLKDTYIEHVYDFLYHYASDSGNVPAC